MFIGGGVGSMARWLVSLKLNSASAHLPVGTLIVNLVGAFIIGLTLAFLAEWLILIPFGSYWLPPVLWGLTTFSTFSVEVVYLIQEGKLAWAAGTILLNVAGSLAMTMLAFILVNNFASQ